MHYRDTENTENKIQLRAFARSFFSVTSVSS
jgi:hypothetical protein